jgi:hypothetical protein
MKIRVSTDGMSISVDVGDKAVSLFSKIASMLVDYLHFDSTNEVEVEKPKLESGLIPKIPNAATASKDTTQESYRGLTYKGFIYWKCKKCGAIRGFCLKKESKGIHCMNCGDESLFDEPLKPLYANCECGQRFKYMTNMDEEMFDMDCIDCGAPIPIKWNDHDKCYQTIKN